MRRASSATELASPAHGLQPCWLPANTGALDWQWRIGTGSLDSEYRPASRQLLAGLRLPALLPDPYACWTCSRAATCPALGAWQGRRRCFRVLSRVLLLGTRTSLQLLPAAHCASLCHCVHHIHRQPASANICGSADLNVFVRRLQARSSFSMRAARRAATASRRRQAGRKVFLQPRSVWPSPPPAPRNSGECRSQSGFSPRKSRSAGSRPVAEPEL